MVGAPQEEQGGLWDRKRRGQEGLSVESKWLPERQRFCIMETSQLLEPTDEGPSPAIHLMRDLMRVP